MIHSKYVRLAAPPITETLFESTPVINHVLKDHPDMATPMLSFALENDIDTEVLDHLLTKGAIVTNDMLFLISDVERLEWLLKQGVDIYTDNGRFFLDVIDKENKELNDFLTLNYPDPFPTDITSLDFIRYDYVDNPNGEELNKERDSLEERYLRTGYICSTDDIKYKLSHINWSELDHLIKSEFYNSNVVSIMLCIMEALCYHRPHEGKEIESWATYINGLNLPDAVVAFAGLDDNPNMLVLKASKEAIHESFVGLYAMNQLRRYIPNFVCVWAGFSFRNVVEIGEEWFWPAINDDKVEYVCYEVIDDAITFDEYIKTASVNEIISAYLQILYALKKAQEVCKFTHYDLHAKNILLRKIPEKETFQLKYESIYLTTNVVATIIDYGYPHVEVDGQSFGDSTRAWAGVMSATCFEIFDAYKLFMMMAVHSYNENKPFFTIARDLFKFFNKHERLDYCIVRQHKYYFALPYTEKTQKYKIQDFVDFILANYDCHFISSEPNEHEVLSCEHQDCANFLQIEKLLGIGPEAGPQTIDEIYLALKHGRTIDITDFHRTERLYHEEIEKLVSETKCLEFPNIVNTNNKTGDYLVSVYDRFRIMLFNYSELMRVKRRLITLTKRKDKLQALFPTHKYRPADVAGFNDLTTRIHNILVAVQQFITPIIQQVSSSGKFFKLRVMSITIVNDEIIKTSKYPLYFEFIAVRNKILRHYGF